MKLFDGKMGAATCLTCRMARRFILAFGGGAFLAWMATGTIPFSTADGTVMQGLMAVAVMFTFLSVFMRMREMRSRFRRRG